jgi:hypothetical protein
VTSQGSATFVNYVIFVNYHLRVHTVRRRYSEFAALHEKVCETGGGGRERERERERES